MTKQESLNKPVNPLGYEQPDSVCSICFRPEELMGSCGDDDCGTPIRTDELCGQEIVTKEDVEGPTTQQTVVQEGGDNIGSKRIRPKNKI